MATTLMRESHFMSEMNLISKGIKAAWQAGLEYIAVFRPYVDKLLENEKMDAIMREHLLTSETDAVVEMVDMLLEQARPVTHTHIPTHPHGRAHSYSHQIPPSLDALTAGRCGCLT